jgi:hypothetical protein
VSRKLRQVPLDNTEIRRLSCRFGTSELFTKWRQDDLVKNAVTSVDEAVRARLRDAIAVEDVDEEQQLKGVLRMLGRDVPEQNQLDLFKERPSHKRK